VRVPCDAVNVMAIAHDVVVHVRVKHVVAGTEDVGRVDAEPDRDGRTVHPDVARRCRRPAYVSVLVARHAPDDPRVRVFPAGDPGPARIRDPNPAAIVEDDPAEGVVAHPNPVAFLRHRPAPGRDVRREVCPDDLAVRHPHHAVRRVVHPLPVGIELRFEVRDGARIGVLKLAGVRGFRWHGLRRGLLRGVIRPRVGLAGLRARVRSRQRREQRDRDRDETRGPLGHRANHEPHSTGKQPTYLGLT
jgi:hypothetical protein